MTRFCTKQAEEHHASLTAALDEAERKAAADLAALEAALQAAHEEVVANMTAIAAVDHAKVAVAAAVANGTLSQDQGSSVLQHSLDGAPPRAQAVASACNCSAAVEDAIQRSRTKAVTAATDSVATNAVVGDPRKQAANTVDDEASVLVKQLKEKVAELELMNGRLESKRTCLECDELADALEQAQWELKAKGQDVEKKHDDSKNPASPQDFHNASCCPCAESSLASGMSSNGTVANISRCDTANAALERPLLFTLPLRTSEGSDGPVHYMPVFSWCVEEARVSEGMANNEVETEAEGMAQNGPELDCARAFLEAHNDAFGFDDVDLNENAKLIGEAIRQRVQTRRQGGATSAPGDNGNRTAIEDDAVDVPVAEETSEGATGD